MRVRQRFDLPLRVCFHLVEHRSLLISVPVFPEGASVMDQIINLIRRPLGLQTTLDFEARVLGLCANPTCTC